jgi:hypothetical protein
MSSVAKTPVKEKGGKKIKKKGQTYEYLQGTSSNKNRLQEKGGGAGVGLSLVSGWS